MSVVIIGFHYTTFDNVFIWKENYYIAILFRIFFVRVCVRDQRRERGRENMKSVGRAITTAVDF